MRTSSRLSNVQPSLTLEITGRAKKLKAAGADVILLAAGEPDFAPPDIVNRAAIAAIERGEGKYSSVVGLPEIRRAAAKLFVEETGVHYSPDDIIVSSGAKQAIFNALYVLCDIGDEVILPRPYWTSYPEIALALGIKPVFWDQTPDTGFRLDASHLERLITPRTRAVMLNSPNNPTGVVTSPEELSQVAGVLRGTRISIITDDIYSKLVYRGGKFTNILSVAPELQEQTVVVNGLSKTYCMTGWRIGFAAGPRALIRDMEIIQGHTTSCANTIAQIAGAAALEHADESHLNHMRQSYAERADFVFETLTSIRNIRCVRPSASFYIFPDISAFFGSRFGGLTLTSAADLCHALLNEYHVAVVPGEAFGYPAGFRLSFATSMDELRRAMTRILEFFGRLS